MSQISISHLVRRLGCKIAQIHAHMHRYTNVFHTFPPETNSHSLNWIHSFNEHIIHKWACSISSGMKRGVAVFEIFSFFAFISKFLNGFDFPYAYRTFTTMNRAVSRPRVDTHKHNRTHTRAHIRNRELKYKWEQSWAEPKTECEHAHNHIRSRLNTMCSACKCIGRWKLDGKCCCALCTGLSRCRWVCVWWVWLMFCRHIFHCTATGVYVCWCSCLYAYSRHSTAVTFVRFCCPCKSLLYTQQQAHTLATPTADTVVCSVTLEYESKIAGRR